MSNLSCNCNRHWFKRNYKSAVLQIGGTVIIRLNHAASFYGATDGAAEITQQLLLTQSHLGINAGPVRVCNRQQDLLRQAAAPL